MRNATKCHSQYSLRQTLFRRIRSEVEVLPNSPYPRATYVLRTERASKITFFTQADPSIRLTSTITKSVFSVGYCSKMRNATKNPIPDPNPESAVESKEKYKGTFVGKGPSKGRYTEEDLGN
jgi:hypothetical protein